MLDIPGGRFVELEAGADGAGEFDAIIPVELRGADARVLEGAGIPGGASRGELEAGGTAGV